MTVSPTIVYNNNNLDEGFFRWRIDGEMKDVPFKFLFEPLGDYKKYLKKPKKKIPNKEKGEFMFKIEELMTNEFN